jgi:hypothetical protein
MHRRIAGIASDVGRVGAVPQLTRQHPSRYPSAPAIMAHRKESVFVGMSSLRAILIGLVALGGIGGCTWIDRHAAADTKSPLGRMTPSPDSMAIEIFFARAAVGDVVLNGKLWNEVDEQRLPSELRRKLTENGFRAGVVGSHVPDDLARLLTISDKPHEKSDESQSINLEEEPAVTLRLLQARAGKRNEVVCSQVYDELPLLCPDEGQLRGRTLRQADARLGFKSFPETSNRVRLELVPELHHGEQQPRWVGTDGVLRLEAGKPREVFDDLSLRVSLAPGEMLVITSLADRPGSLGHYFFTQPTSERLAQKLLVIRIAQAGSDAQFSPQPVDTADLLFGE